MFGGVEFGVESFQCQVSSSKCGSPVGMNTLGVGGRRASTVGVWGLGLGLV